MWYIFRIHFHKRLLVSLCAIVQDFNPFLLHEVLHFRRILFHCKVSKKEQTDMSIIASPFRSSSCSLQYCFQSKFSQKREVLLVWVSWAIHTWSYHCKIEWRHERHTWPCVANRASIVMVLWVVCTLMFANNDWTLFSLWIVVDCHFVNI